MSFVSFSDQVQSFLASQLARANPPLKKAINAALQIIKQTNAEQMSPQRSLQAMRKVSSCFKKFPKVRQGIQDRMYTELEKMKQVEEKVLPQKRPAAEIEDPSAKKIKQATTQEPKEVEEAEKEAARGVMKTAGQEHKVCSIPSHSEEAKALASIGQVSQALSGAVAQGETGKKEQAGQRIVLKADMHVPPSQDLIRSHMTMHPQLADLPEEKREAIVQECLRSYQKALISFDKVVAVVAWDSPEARQYADTLCHRLAAIADAYFEVQVDRGIVSGGVVKELNRLMNLSQFFASGSYDTGSVGYNPLSIQKAIREGNLREKMTLAYTAMFGLVMTNVFIDKELVSLINKRLALLPKETAFQIDEAEIDQILDKKNIYYRQSELITGHRIQEEGRPRLRPGYSSPPSQFPEGPTIGQIHEPSKREIRAGLGDYVSDEELEAMSQSLKARKVGCLGGALIFAVNPQSTFAQVAVALGGLPVVTGPSGTAESFFNVARAVGIGQNIKEGMLALAAWLIPSRDHSLHEIRVILPEFGVSYSGLPEDFKGLYNESFTQKVKEKMPEGQMPPYFLGPEYQMKVAQQL